MATSRIPNRYISRADLIAFLDLNFSQHYEQYTVSVGYSLEIELPSDSCQEHSDAWVVSHIPREISEVNYYPSLKKQYWSAE